MDFMTVVTSDLTTLVGLLTSLLLPVGAIAWFVSNFLENVPWWVGLSATVKSGALLVASLIVGALAYTVLHNVPGTVLDQLQPLYALVYSIVTAWLAMQVQHQNFEVRKSRKEVRAAQLKIAKGERG